MISRAVLFAGTLLLAASPALAEPVWTSAPSIMRRAPYPTARVVQEIPPSARIFLKNCRGSWCYASWRNRSGYIPAYAVAAEAPPPGFAAPPMAGGGGALVVGPPPVAGPGFVWGGPYVGGGWGWQRW